MFTSPAAAAFYGEQVTIAAHMRQAATLAEADGASSELIVGALLHDIGHLNAELDPGVRNRDHAELAMSFLQSYFGPEVTEPVRLHVDAKRYLVAVDSEYENTLSPASVHTLKLQGGPMTPSECKEFSASQFSDDAVRLRRWDELAKDPSAKARDLAHFETHIDRVKLRAK